MLPKVRTVMYCTGLTSKSKTIFARAYTLAKQLGAELVVLHVMETLTARQRALVEGYSGQGTLGPLIDEVEANAAKKLPAQIEELCAETSQENVWRDTVTRIIVASGDVIEQILEHVESVGAEIVVVGAHPPATLPERLTGSVAHRLLRECPVPVLTVRFDG